MSGFLADENVAPRVTQYLRKQGFEVFSIHEENLSWMNDEEILKLARRKQKIIITHDKDFGSLIHQPYQIHGGVILLRLKNQSPPNVIRYLLYFLRKINLGKIKGRLVIIQEERIRII